LERKWSGTICGIAGGCFVMALDTHHVADYACDMIKTFIRRLKMSAAIIDDNV
jgi:hypothetical protein